MGGRNEGPQDRSEGAKKYENKMNFFNESENETPAWYVAAEMGKWFQTKTCPNAPPCSTHRLETYQQLNLPESC